MDAGSAGTRAGAFTSPRCDLGPRTDPPDNCASTGGSILHVTHPGQQVIHAIVFFTPEDEPSLTAHDPFAMFDYAATGEEAVHACVDDRDFPQDLTVVAHCMYDYVTQAGYREPRGLAVITNTFTFGMPNGHIIVASSPATFHAVENGLTRRGPTFDVVVLPPPPL